MWVNNMFKGKYAVALSSLHSPFGRGAEIEWNVLWMNRSKHATSHMCIEHSFSWHLTPASWQADSHSRNPQEISNDLSLHCLAGARIVDIYPNTTSEPLTIWIIFTPSNLLSSIKLNYETMLVRLLLIALCTNVEGFVQVQTRTSLRAQVPIHRYPVWKVKHVLWLPLISYEIIDQLLIISILMLRRPQRARTIQKNSLMHWRKNWK
jgi:hypothetical protein